MTLFPQQFQQRFELREKLDTDNLGESYRAYDRELDTEVRLKLFHPYLRDDVLLRKLFRIELKALRRLCHPGILAGYELYDDHDQLFFTTELPRSESLRMILDRERLTVHRTEHIVRQLLEIVRYVHENGVLHRDIRPDHLYLGEGDILKLGGFSVVKLADYATVTMRSQLLLSPRYQAPEILRGKAATISSDLYSVGLVLVEMLAGKALSQEETLLGQLADKERLIEDWESFLQLKLSGKQLVLGDSVLPRLLHPEPLERYVSAREALADLEWSVESDERPEQSAVSTDIRTVLPPDHDLCPVCQAQLVPKVAICLNCGTSVQRLVQWGRGPYLVLAAIAFQKTKSGKWQSKWRQLFSRTSLQRLKIIKLLRMFYARLPESGQNSFSRFAVVARRVDKETADGLIHLFEANGIKALKIRIGAVGDRLFGGFLHIPGRTMAGFLAAFTVLSPFLVVLAAMKPTLAGSIFIPIWLLMDLSIIGSMRLLFFKPGPEKLARYVEPQALMPRVSSELVNVYTSIKDDRLKRVARHFMAETRSIVHMIREEHNRTGLSDIDFSATMTVLEGLEKSAMDLLATVPETSSRREAELLETARRLEAKSVSASSAAKDELKTACDDIFRTLEKLKEAHHYRVKAEEQVAMIIEKVRRLGQQLDHRRELQLEARANALADELHLLEAENDAFRDL